jgi:hypothetical protein
MNAIINPLACAVALVLAACPVLSAQESPRPGGRVVVLDNERVLEGEVQREADQFLIRLNAGELRIPAAKVLKVCANLEEVYQFLAERANLRDAGDRLRLARWCQSHGLREQAIAEAREALQLRPGHAETKQFLAMLERSSPLVPAPVSQVLEAAPPQPAQTPLEVSAECLALFASKVQPILMNTCASCHANEKGGSFVLQRCGDAGGRRTTQLNLTAVVKLVSFDQPGASPLLCKACCAHGGAAQAPVPNRQSPPFVTLQGFVDLLTAQNPQLRPNGAQSVSAAPRPVEGPPVARAVEMAPTAVNTTAPRAVDSQASTTPPPPAALEPRPPSALNAYDAEEFNRMAHPKQ